MDLKKYRDAYVYPMVGLGGCLSAPRPLAFTTSHALEAHHARLLGSDQDEEVLMGYLSTLYWGHYSGTNGKHNPGRALAKVGAAVNGYLIQRNGQTYRAKGLADFGHNNAATVIREAKRLLVAHLYGQAISTLNALPQLGVAFASKVAAFLAPHTCAVIDSVIATKYPVYDFRLRGKYVSNAKSNFECYQHYCLTLIAQAQAQNALGQSAHWRDHDGTLYRWRAVDVERALYSQ
ncbi:hypothetical protein KSS94_18030 [Pseudomonas fakonensis]|uniref:Uncharacterized protein n=1 Tax=Pseudomonas fakonensis TaxID=2842355 RepID=A0ABX8N0L7_9PSED|nr:hypothetical protein [Pseudomonas fakonensis]QXH49834.1 hypothetical protein KSS94_18030 [Pseudomonas fakonensis]